MCFMDFACCSGEKTATRTMLQSLKIALHQQVNLSIPNNLPLSIPVEDISIPINTSTIKAVLQEHVQFRDTATQYADLICESAPTLFVILIYIDQEHRILSIVREHWTDTCLPILPDQNTVPHHNPLSKALRKWDPTERARFQIQQWHFLPPRFTKAGQHLDLYHACILPFTQHRVYKHINEDKTIYAVRINSRCQTIYHPDGSPDIAIKRFSARSVANFLHERKIITRLAQLHNKNIMALIATYKHRGEYFILFPLAQCDLATYWMQTNPVSDFSEHVYWFARSLLDLTTALRDMHHMSKEVGCSSSARREGLFHGDIKPQNILVMPDKMLVLNDFGLSSWTCDPAFIATTRTYEAPEQDLDEIVGLESDVWSFGCVAFEFLIWLLYGGEGIRRFATERIMATPGSGLPMKDDNFYMLQYKNKKVVGTRLRETIKRYEEDMRRNKNFQGVLKEILEVVMQDMLVVNRKDRGSIDAIALRFRVILARLEATRISE